MKIITGTPRCGTNFIASLFTQAGIPMGHECYYGLPYGGTWMETMRGEASWLAAPFLERHTDVIHIVRNPIKVISSMKHDKFLDEPFNPYAEFAIRHLPTILDYEGLDRYIHYWIEWNKKINGNRYKLEDIVENPNIILPNKENLNTDKKNSYGDVPQLDLTSCKLYPELKEAALLYEYQI